MITHVFKMSFALCVVAAGAPAQAQQYEIGYPKGSLAYEDLVSLDYASAERRLRHDMRVPADDPAKLINYGRVLAKTGRTAEAAALFQRALGADEIELILADGNVVSSREAARRALRSLAR